MAVINDHSRQNDKGSKSTRHNNEKVTTEVPPSPSFTVLCFQKMKRVITTKRVSFCCHAMRIKLGYTTLLSGGARSTDITHTTHLQKDFKQIIFMTFKGNITDIKIHIPQKAWAFCLLVYSLQCVANRRPGGVPFQTHL